MSAFHPNVCCSSSFEAEGRTREKLSRNMMLAVGVCEGKVSEGCCDPD